MTEGERRPWRSPGVWLKHPDKEDGEEQDWRVCEDGSAPAMLGEPARWLCMEVPLQSEVRAEDADLGVIRM